VPVHSGESIGPGLLAKILRDVDLSREELEELLSLAEMPANKPFEMDSPLTTLCFATPSSLPAIQGQRSHPKARTPLASA